MKKIAPAFLLILAVVITAGVATKAAFEDKGVVKGATFSVGNADVKLLDDLRGGVESSNLLDQKPGPVFANLFPGWADDYLVKIYNNGTLAMNVVSQSNYSTADDPGSLREYILAEVFNWNDANSNGVAESEEVSQTSIAKKSIIKWKSEGIDLGRFDAGELRGFLIRFSADTVSSTKQGLEAKYDFEFAGTTDGVIQ